MQRKHLNVDGGNAEQCKVRKRGSSSSSSSSTLLRNYRLKRAILVGKRAGSSTPVPMWKMSRNDKAAEGGELGKEMVISARKLAATLWETNANWEVVQEAKRDKISRLSKLGSMPFYCSDPSFTPLSKKMDQYYGDSCHRRRTSNGSQKLVPSDSSLVGCYVEVDQNQELTHGRTPRANRVKHRLKDLQGALATSKELLKVMNNMWHLEEERPTHLSLVSALKMEIDRACIQVNKVIHEHKSNQQELDFLLQQFEMEKASCKMKEKERIRSAISSVAGELEIEKRLKRQSERLNKKLGRELADTKASLLKATKELEREKKAREILEQVCDELARGVGEDRAIVAQLTRESAKVREELEKEREMLHLADVLREERVQMKLLEAKYQFEEKNAVVDELKNELEAYLKSKVDRDEQGNGTPNYERIRELEKYLRETLPVPNQYQDQGNKDGRIVFKEEDQGDDEEDSADSDLHSIELEVEENGKTFKWNATNKMAMDGKIKGSECTSEKRQRKSICIERQTSDGIEWEFSPTRHIASHGHDGNKIFEFSSKDWKQESQDEIERYNMIKDLRDNIVSSSKIASSHESTSPKTIWDQHNLASQDLSKVVREAFGVLQEAV